MSAMLERFHEIVKEVQERPYLEVLKFTVNSPIEAKALEAVEARLGAPLAAPIRDFYQEANGLELQWRFRLDLKEEEVERLDKQYDDYTFEQLDDPDNRFANIHLIPLEDAVLHRKWGMIDEMTDDLTMEFAGETFTYR